MSYGRPGNNQAYYGGAPPTRQQQFGLPPPQPQTFGGPPQFQDGYSQGPPQDGFSSQGFPLQPQLGFGGPPAGQFPPQQQYGAQPMPSPGYDPRATAMGDASADAHVLRGAMKGFGTDEATLIRVLSKPDPLQMALLRNTYAQQIGRNLEKDVASETSSYFKEGLLALVRGPLMQDVHNVHKAIKGAGTKESVLNDVLLGRSNADMRAIKQAYQTEYKRMMEADVKADLSMKTERLFGLVMQATRAEETMPVNPQDIDRDVTELHRATEGRTGADQIMVCSILSQRSDGQIRFIARDYQQRYGMGFEKVIKKEFSGHMEDALLLMFGRATDRAMTDAVQIEDSMKGIGTKDDLLVNRIMRMHWDRLGMDQVKRAYAHRYKTDLIERVKGEVRGDVEKLLVACLT